MGVGRAEEHVFGLRVCGEEVAPAAGVVLDGDEAFGLGVLVLVAGGCDDGGRELGVIGGVEEEGFADLGQVARAGGAEGVAFGSLKDGA